MGDWNVSDAELQNARNEYNKITLYEERKMTQEKKKGTYNPKIGNGFVNEKFGPESILVNIDAEGLDVVMKNLQVGSSILLKYNKVTSKGNKHYFAEILPPYKGNINKTKKTVATSDLD